MLFAQNITKNYTIEKGVFGKKFNVIALKNVNFSIEKGEIMGLVGESGSGKSTLAKILSGIEKPDRGKVLLEDKDLINYKRIEIAHKVSMIFQDPFTSLNPKLSVKFQLDEILSLRKKRIKKFYTKINNLKDLLAMVSLSSKLLDSYPYQLSGGELQRVAIARALILEAEYLIADEPTSSLDLSVQASIIELLLNLNKSRNLAILFITHDLNLVESLTDKIILMKDGYIVKEKNYYLRLKESTISL